MSAKQKNAENKYSASSGSAEFPHYEDWGVEVHKKHSDDSRGAGGGASYGKSGKEGGRARGGVSHDQKRETCTGLRLTYELDKYSKCLSNQQENNPKQLNRRGITQNRCE